MLLVASETGAFYMVLLVFFGWLPCEQAAVFRFQAAAECCQNSILAITLPFLDGLESC